MIRYHRYFFEPFERALKISKLTITFSLALFLKPGCLKLNKRERIVRRESRCICRQGSELEAFKAVNSPLFVDPFQGPDTKRQLALVKGKTTMLMLKKYARHNIHTGDTCMVCVIR